MGATGDLARKKLFPAFSRLAAADLLPPGFGVVAVARRPYTPATFREEVRVSIKQFAGEVVPAEVLGRDFLPRITYFQADLRDRGSYARLHELLRQNGQAAANLVFYLALAPEHFGPVVAGLEQHNLARSDGQYWRRLVIEKPFGWDLASARRLNEEIRRVFPEKDIYRIDHYLGKEMIQNIMVIRFANSFFEPVWNNKYIDHVQISSLEVAGVEGRGAYYEKAGALRDMVQNHMLQLVSLIAMEPPTSLVAEDIREEKVNVLRSLQPLTPERAYQDAVRGQYGPGYVENVRVPGYQEEPGATAGSTTETFTALKIFVDNFRWAGVPFYLRTGKRLACKSTEIVIQFKSLPEVLYFRTAGGLAPNVLAIRIQPREGVFLRLNAKKPGTDRLIVPIKLDFCQNCEIGANSPEAYERLVLDVMRGDPTLFTGWEEVEYAWRFVDPLAAAWAQAPPSFPNYAAGTWGPEAAERLIVRDGRQWAVPEVEETTAPITPGPSGEAGN